LLGIDGPLEVCLDEGGAPEGSLSPTSSPGWRRRRGSSLCSPARPPWCVKP